MTEGRFATAASDLDFVTAGIAVWEADGTLAFANRGFRQTLGPTQDLRPASTYEDFLRDVLRSGEWLVPDTDTDWLERWRSYFGADQSVEQDLADGRTILVVYKPASQGRSVMTVTDVTAAKNSERRLRLAKERAEEIDQAKSRFLRAANHDLRQPLSTLKILVHTCEYEQTQESRRDILHAMEIAVSVMEELLGALLHIGQLDAGRIVPRRTTFQLAQIFERLDIQFRHLAEARGLQLRFVGGSRTVTSDKALLERIVTNLVSNAIKYASVGRVLVGCRSHGGRLRIEVWDTGRGIAPKDQAKIFDEFFRVSEAKALDKSGLGLGLNIVKRLADLLEHDLQVCSQVDAGSCFSLTVPAGNVWHSNIGEPDISELVGGEFVGVATLLIEDDPVLRQAMRELLERWGMSVHAVASGASARETLDHGKIRPDLIISDYSLSGERGTLVIQELRSHLGGDVPAFIMTADTEPRVLDDIRRHGLHVLVKPAGPARIRVLMHNLLYETDRSEGARP